MEKEFKGKAIYNPSGKAGEYSYWACNFYKGCSNRCKYCYLKKGVLAKSLGGETPVLKSCFKNEEDAINVFERELLQNKAELKQKGLFFTFTSDPFLGETMDLTLSAIAICIAQGVPVKVLTKCSENAVFALCGDGPTQKFFKSHSNKIAFGVTLTGCDDQEPGADSNISRIMALNQFRCLDYKTFASIEPIVDFERSFTMIEGAIYFTDLFKIGLMGGCKQSKTEVADFINRVHVLFYSRWGVLNQPKIYWKDGILKAAGMDRETLPHFCVNRDYNLFETN